MNKPELDVKDFNEYTDKLSTYIEGVGQNLSDLMMGYAGLVKCSKEAELNEDVIKTLERQGEIFNKMFSTLDDYDVNYMIEELKALNDKL